MTGGTESTCLDEPSVWGRVRALAPLLAFVSLAACGGTSEKVATGSAGSAPAPGALWAVRIGSQGGFTGGGSGQVVRSDGTVLRWSQITPEDSLSYSKLGRADSKSLRDLYRAMVAPELVALQQRETGNLTAFLEWEEGAESRRYSWTERLGEPNLPPPLQRAYIATLAAVASARP